MTKNLFSYFRNKLLAFVLFIVLILGITNLFSMVYSTILSQHYSQMVRTIFNYNELEASVVKCYASLVQYIQSESQIEQDTYEKYALKAKELITLLSEAAPSDRIYYEISILNNIFQSFSEGCSTLMNAHTVNNSGLRYQKLSEIESVSKYMNQQIDDLLEMQIIEERHLYTRLTESLSMLRFITVSIIILIIAIAIFFSIYVTNRISIPILKLSSYAGQIANGNFLIPDIAVKSKDEISQLIVSLNRMKHKTYAMLNEVQERSELKNQLQMKENENIKMISSLRNAEIKILQSQINPHFLFNTLNSINSLASQNRSTEVVNLIENLSDMLRYNLKKLDHPVTLMDELHNLERYLFIQSTRFTSKVDFQIENNSVHPEIAMPNLILQPLVENALMHGLKPYDYNGFIKILVYDEAEFVIITVEDNGIGIDVDRLKKDSLMDNGIGIDNVTNRLNFFYNRQDIITIESELGNGTLITLRLPIPEKKEEPYVSFTDCRR